MKNRKTKLDIFDVDGTLYKTPIYRENWWKSNFPETYAKIKDDWWTSRLSLGAPHVPFPAPKEFHIESVLERAFESQNDPNTYFVIMTGRVEPLRDLVEMHIKEGMGLDPERIILKPVGARTGQFKCEQISSMIEEFGVTEVEMWEDQRKYVIRYSELLENDPRISKYQVNHISDDHSVHLHFEHEQDIVNRIMQESFVKHHLKHHKNS